MNRRNRTQLALGIILLLAATWLILSKFVPGWPSLFNLPLDNWPIWIIIAGGIILLIGLLVGAPGMAVPACITAGIGGILLYQNTYSEWTSWSYLWTLIPGFVGVGVLLSSLLEGTFRKEFREGLNLLFISIIMFLIFATAFGGLNILGPNRDFIVAGLLMLLGLWFLVRGLVRRQKKE